MKAVMVDNIMILGNNMYTQHIHVTYLPSEASEAISVSVKDSTEEVLLLRLLADDFLALPTGRRKQIQHLNFAHS